MNVTDIQDGSTFQIDEEALVTKTQYTTDFVLAIPHAGTLIPTDLQERYELGTQALQDTDLFTDELYPLKEGIVIQTRLNRYVVNMNRRRETHGDVNGYDDEDALRNYLKGMKPAWDAGNLPTALLTYHDTYHEYVHSALQTVKQDHRTALLITGHSMNDSSDTNTPDSGDRPDFDICTEHGATAGDPVVTAMHETLEQHGYDVERNEPYSGGYTIRNHSNKQEGFHCIQLEVNKRLYMDEYKLQRNDDFNTTQQAIHEAIQASVKALQ